jgi:hypothetical protein
MKFLSSRKISLHQKNLSEYFVHGNMSKLSDTSLDLPESDSPLPKILEPYIVQIKFKDYLSWPTDLGDDEEARTLRLTWETWWKRSPAGIYNRTAKDQHPLSWTRARVASY